MKRAGFTMIELIFVIVILGILSAVALPKLIGVKEQAEEGIVKGFVGTLNRTTGPTKWSESLMDGNSGSITSYSITSADTDFPADFNTSNTYALTNCKSPSDANTTANPVITGNTYSVYCRDGNASTSPRFWYAEGTGSKTIPSTNDTLKLQ